MLNSGDKSEYSVCSIDSLCKNSSSSSERLRHKMKHHDRCHGCNDVRIECHNVNTSPYCDKNENICTRCCMENFHKHYTCRICKTKIAISCKDVCYNRSLFIDVCLSCYDENEKITDCMDKDCDRTIVYNSLNFSKDEIPTKCKYCYYKDNVYIRNIYR